MVRQSANPTGNPCRPGTSKKPKSNRKRPWTEKEDALLIKLVEKYGPVRWSSIARSITGRLGKQCRERWHNHLNPEIKKTDWGRDEEWILYLTYYAIGSKWANMTQILMGRTDNAIKNHWNSALKKRMPDYEEILREILENNNYEPKKEYLRECLEDEELMKHEQELLEMIRCPEGSGVNQDESSMKDQKKEKNQEKEPQNLFQPENLLRVESHFKADSLCKAENLFKAENSVSTENKENTVMTKDKKEEECCEGPKLVRMNSVLSEKRDRFNYSMMFQTPPRGKMADEGWDVGESERPITVEVMLISQPLEAPNSVLDSPSKFMMM